MGSGPAPASAVGPQLRVSAWAPLRHRAFRMLWLAQLQAFLRAGTEPDVERFLVPPKPHHHDSDKRQVVHENIALTLRTSQQLIA